MRTNNPMRFSFSKTYRNSQGDLGNKTFTDFSQFDHRTTTSTFKENPYSFSGISFNVNR